MAVQKDTADANMPVFGILAQYIKDLSFESPNAPQVLQARDKALSFNVNININTAPLEDDNYDVTLSFDIKAGEDKNLLFNIELVYGGVFKLQNFPQEHIAQFLHIECARMLFPFARQIIANTTQTGGFPPLMLDPIDFASLFQRRMAEENAMAQTEGGHA